MNRFDLASERKLQIIKATIDCITRYGYSNFSMQDVALVANVSKGIIHYYFLNKEDLMMGVLDHVSEGIEEHLAATMDSNMTPIKRLANVIWICSAIVQSNREYYRINMDFWTQIDQKENVRKQIALHYSKFRQTIASIIQDGIDQSFFRKGNAHHFASVIIAIIDGIALQWLFDETVFNYGELVKQCEESILSFLEIR